MNNGLTDEQIADLVNYRYSRAQETLAEIPILRADRLYNTAINRLYYACYFAVSALLSKNRINSSTHAGVRQMFGLYFVKTGKISKEHGRFFSIMFDRRQSSDYDDFVDASEQEIDELYPKAQALITEVGKLLKE